MFVFFSFDCKKIILFRFNVIFTIIESRLFRIDLRLVNLGLDVRIVFVGIVEV